MNLPKLSLSLAALAAALTVIARADALAEQALLDHVDAVVPAHLSIETLNVRVIGNPAVKAKVELTLRAAETLYSETPKVPALTPVAAELTPDLRNQEPRVLRILKVVTAEGAVTKPLNFDFSIATGASGVTLGKIEGRKFVSFGLPRSEFAADGVAEDTAAGRAEIARWDKSVADYNAALKRHDSRVRTDRNTGLARETVGRGLDIFDRVKGGNGGTANGVNEVLETVTTGPAKAAKPAAGDGAKPKAEAGDKAGEVLKKLGGLFSTAGGR